MNKRPNSMRHLDDAIRRACGRSAGAYVRARTIMANAIVANALPDGVVKGGTAIKMRFGDSETRFTTDLDTATATDPALYAMRLGQALSQGWEGFTGRVVPREPASPGGVPDEYVMQPFDVKLSYRGKPWCTVPLEVGHNEIGDADVAEWVELADAAELFGAVGLPAPGKAPLMPLDHQIAQKIHAVSSVGDRARDLVDLQLIFSRSEVDLSALRETCERLFAYRKAQAWPPEVREQPGWAELYAAQAEGLSVARTVSEAVDWANSLIDQIRKAD
ncbi:hypothetical protein GMI70_01770 [Eggerthellaceae bacterium zg-893]|nr:hypothetical protein [Eggerthellaceae bacterium zg-893]